MSAEVLLVAVLEARLTPRQRESFIDCAIIGRSGRDVAADIGVTPSAVYELLRKARKRVARTLDDTTRTVAA